MRRDIGGAEQRIHHMATTWSAVRFLLVLLPVWVAAYTYGDRTFRVIVNGRTGKVRGQRPYSPWKIALLVAVVVLVAAAVVAAVLLAS